MTLTQQNWEGKGNAGAASLAELSSVAGGKLPASYLEFLKENNGGEGSLSVNPLYLILDDASTVTDTIRSGIFDEFFPGLLVIGGNGGGEAVAFDFRNDFDGRVVHFDMVNSDLEESVLPLANSFSELLNLLGDAE